MKDINEFYNKYPIVETELSKGTFKYRYYKNPDSTETLVLFTGGIGFSDLLFRYFDAFSKDYSVMTFDYLPEFPSVKDFTAALAELLNMLHIKAWLVGQSLGGFIAQVIAKDHPEVVKGLILSNTGTLSENLSEAGTAFLTNMLNKENKLITLLKIMPFSLYKKMTGLLLSKMTSDDYTPSQKAAISEMKEITVTNMNRPYEKHMIEFLVDLKNHQGSKASDFEYLKGRVLLMLSKDDKTFLKDVTDALIDIMPEPQIETGLLGGHLAMILHPLEYEKIVTDFINSHE